MTKKDDDLLKECRERFKHAAEVYSGQRLQETDDLAFQVPDNQWDVKAKVERDSAGRPRLSISKLDQPIQRVLNQQRAAHLGISIQPISEDANKDTAEALQGLYRQIERDSTAMLSRAWAYHRGVLCGRGFWRVDCDYDENSSSAFDQKIIIEQIYFQDSVLPDPSATKPDLSDAEYFFVETWVDEKTYRRRWPKADLPSTAYELELTSQAVPDWTKTTDGIRTFRVVEYWRFEYGEDEAIVQLEDGREMPEKDMPEGAEIAKSAGGIPMRRMKQSRKVLRSHISGYDVLETTPWDGRYIPIIPFVGRELQPFDGKRRLIGLINHSKDGQKFFNYAASTYVERMSQEPKAPIVGYVGQFENLEDEWDRLNTENVTRLEVNPVTVGAQVLPLPQRMQIDLTGVSLAGQAMQTADGMIQSTTTVYDAGLGRMTEDTRKTSGRALLALQQESDVATSDFMDQLKIAMGYEAKVVLDLIPYKYDRPGRVTAILRGENEESEMVILNQPYTLQDGRPVQAPPGMPVGPRGEGQPSVREYNLGVGRYGVSISVGKSYQTRLEHGAEFMTQVLEKMPQFLPLLGDILFKYRNDPGAAEIARRLTKVRERTYPGIGESEDGQPTPEQLTAQLEAQKQQLQQMQTTMQAMDQELKLDRAKQEATILKSQIETQSRERISQGENQTALMVAEIRAELARQQEEMRAHAKRIEMALDHANETRGRHEEMAHETALSGMEGARADRERRDNLAVDAVKAGMSSAQQDADARRKDAGERRKEAASERTAHHHESAEDRRAWHDRAAEVNAGILSTITEAPEPPPPSKEGGEGE